MRNKKLIKQTAEKVATATSTGQVIKYESKKSTEARINELLQTLGIDKDTFNFQLKNRIYNKMYSHKYLGFNG